jgi:3-oxoisoapionate decarboxylase
MPLLGIDSFSLRWQGWNAFQFLDHAAELGLDNVQFSERGNLASHDPGYLREVKSHADNLGLTIEIGMGSFDRHSATFRPEFGSAEQQLTDMLRVARAVESPVLRCFLGNQEDRVGAVPFREHLAECVRTLRVVAPLARDLGVKIAVENHGGVDLLARELLALVETAGPDHVGVCLDTGNPAYAGEDPLLATEILAPHVVTSHVRDTRVWATPDGALAQWAPLGEGDVALPEILAILAAHAPAAPINLEIITGWPPASLPYLDPAADFWDRYPDMPARDFARFVALTQRGTPGPLDQLTLPPGQRVPSNDEADAYHAQQREHFAQSVRYAREVLRIGERERETHAHS